MSDVVIQVVEPGQSGSPTIVEVLVPGEKGLPGAQGLPANPEYEYTVNAVEGDGTLFRFPLSELPGYQAPHDPSDILQVSAEIWFWLSLRQQEDASPVPDTHQISAIVNVRTIGGGIQASGRVLAATADPTLTGDAADAVTCTITGDVVYGSCTLDLSTLLGPNWVVHGRARARGSVQWMTPV